MTSDVQAITDSMRLMPHTALVLEPHLADALLIVSALSALGFHVTVADTFKDAKHLLTVQPPALLVTELRLAEYNGLHLVLRASSMRPGTASIITSAIADSVLQGEAERMGATYVQMPATAEAFKAATMRTLTRRPDDPPVRAPFERRTSDRRTADLRGITADDSGDRRKSERRRFALTPLVHPQSGV